MRVLDLFSGTGSFSDPFRERGHEVTTLDMNEPSDLRMDIRDLHAREGDFEVVLASPPCQAFSVASIQHHWKGGHPDRTVKEGLRLVFEVFRIVHEVRPRFIVMENPRGMLRKVIGHPRETVFYCSFGDTRMKPTDLWGRFPSITRPCAPHTAAPRGSNAFGTTQGMTGTLSRSRMPHGLGEALCTAMEAVIA